MSVGAAIALGAVIGLVLGILVSVTTDVPLAPEAGVVLGALIGWLSHRGAGLGNDSLTSEPRPERVLLSHGSERLWFRPKTPASDDKQAPRVSPPSLSQIAQRSSQLVLGSDCRVSSKAGVGRRHRSLPLPHRCGSEEEVETAGLAVRAPTALPRWLVARRLGR
jgi:hypothetical protein